MQRLLRTYSIFIFFVLVAVFFLSLVSALNVGSFVYAQVGEADAPVFGTGGAVNEGGGGAVNIGGGGATNRGGGGAANTGGGGVTNPLNFNSIQAFFAKVLEFVVMLGIPFIIFMIIYTGFKFVTAQGNPEAIKTAQKMFMYTIIGGMLILGASIVANVIKGTVDSITLLDHVLQAAAPLFNL